mmetsp:Transcript_14105/g.38626  ORF Transcript_14105/g.38626 Transcript_14105/m.38626 type:complete len:259 (+) Transcript_14105:1132-1908(+)
MGPGGWNFVEDDGDVQRTQGSCLERGSHRRFQGVLSKNAAGRGLVVHPADRQWCSALHERRQQFRPPAQRRPGDAQRRGTCCHGRGQPGPGAQAFAVLAAVQGGKHDRGWQGIRRWLHGRLPAVFAAGNRQRREREGLLLDALQRLPVNVRCNDHASGPFHALGHWHDLRHELWQDSMGSGRHHWCNEGLLPRATPRRVAFHGRRDVAGLRELAAGQPRGQCLRRSDHPARAPRLPKVRLVQFHGDVQANPQQRPGSS